MPSASMVTSLKPVLNSPFFKVLSPDQQVAVLDAYWRGIRAVLPDAFDDPQQFSIQKGIGVTVLHTLLTQVTEIARSRGMAMNEAETYRTIMQDVLEGLEGENGTGEPVVGLDFWRASQLGAAGSYSSSAGRRVLSAKLQQRLPRVLMQ